MLDVSGLTLSYGAEPVLEGADLRVNTGQFVSLVGPSGSGKSSLLRAIIGLQRPSAGTVTCDLDRGDLGILFQDDALLPWRTALDNIALGLRIRGKPRPHARDEAEMWLGRLGLAGFGQRFPRSLSGGQRKRVALAQVLALRPRLLLMDEPFAALDAIVLSDVVYLLAQGPRARIRQRYAVPIPRPRDIMKARTNPSFAPLLERLWQDLSDEVDIVRRV